LHRPYRSERPPAEPAWGRPDPIPADQQLPIPHHLLCYGAPAGL